MAALAEKKGKRKVSEVIICDQSKFTTLVENIRKGGWDKLQVVADFDRTLTKAEVNGEDGATCHGIIESLSCLSAEYQKLTLTLFNKYYPIEICHEMSVSEKIPHMLDWYKQVHDALIKEGVTKEHLEEAVRGSNVTFRDGAKNIVEILHMKKVPFLVFSAGIADVIQEVFKQKFNIQLGQSSLDTTHVISNWMQFEERSTSEGIKEFVSGFSEPLIHMYNKNEGHTKGHDYEAMVRERENVILLGDSVGDVNMCEGIPHNNVLKIGFLNKNVEKLLPKYKAIYDVVITNDGSMDFVEHHILRHLM